MTYRDVEDQYSTWKEIHIEYGHEMKSVNSINTYMNNRNAKKLIKRAKCCPEYYSEAEVKYAKMIKNREKTVD